MRKCIHYWTPNTSIEFLYFPWKKKSNHKEVTILALLFSPKPEEYLYSHKRKSNWVASEAHLPTPHHTQLLSWPSVLSKKHEKETTEMNSHEILRRKLTLILMNANDPHLNLRAGVVLSSVRFSCSVMSDSLWPHGPQHTRPPCPSPTPGVYPDSSPLIWWCHPTSCPLSSPSSPIFNLSQHQGLFQWVNSLHQVAKVLKFQLQHQSFQWTPRTDLL